MLYYLSKYHLGKDLPYVEIVSLIHTKVYLVHMCIPQKLESNFL